MICNWQYQRRFILFLEYMNNKEFDKAAETTTFLAANGFRDAHAGVVLGTGLAHFVKQIGVEHEISYTDIPNFPLSTVESHKGRLIYGNVAGKRIIALQGRFHFYEGYSMQQVVFPVRVLKMLGINYLLVSNAAGALNKDFKKGELMLINDHINLLAAHPLTGTNDERFGTRFPDMSAPYNIKLNNLLKKFASENKITLHQGVYVAVTGPTLETRAEYRMLRILGADAVGMSTVPEVIAANHVQLPCAAVSVLTDECDPDNLKPVSIEEIIAVAAVAEQKLTVLFKKVIQES